MSKNKIIAGVLTGLLLTAATSTFIFSSCASTKASADDSLWKLTSPTFSHDPSVICTDDAYYSFFTADGIGCAYSKDGLYWRNRGSVFSKAPAWWKEYVPAKTDFNTWAPHVTQYNGKYYVFYAVSTFGSNTSCIGLVSTQSLNSPEWEDLGMVIKSDSSCNYNCIDPAFIETPDGIYLSFGSFWNGLYIVNLDPETLKPAEGSKPKCIASRSGGAIEAPYIFTPGNGWYYLLCSFDLCCRGTNSTYNIRYGRAESPLGPFTDKSGKELTSGGGTILMSTKGRYVGPGGQEAFLNKDGNWVLCAHYYDAYDNGISRLLLKDLAVTQDGWLE